MAELVHEAWIGDGDAGPTLCLAGPDGKIAREKMVGPNPKLLFTIKAGCHFEAMTLFYQRMGFGTYSTDRPEDHEPYPEEWAARQSGSA